MDMVDNPIGRSAHSLTKVGDELVLFAGYEGKERLNDVWVLKPIKKPSVFPEKSIMPSAALREAKCLSFVRDCRIWTNALPPSVIQYLFSNREPQNSSGLCVYFPLSGDFKNTVSGNEATLTGEWEWTKDSPALF